MGQSVWHRDDIAQFGATLIAVAPTPEFAAGVAALCHALGAPVRLPHQAVVIDVPALGYDVRLPSLPHQAVVIDGNGREVTP